MKIERKTLLRIIKEEVTREKTLSEIEVGDDTGAGRTTKSEVGIINQIMDRMKQSTPSQLKTIDDPREVIAFLIAMIDVVKELNDDDFTDPEVTRTLQILRTRILPELEREINNPESEEKEEEQS